MIHKILIALILLMILLIVWSSLKGYVLVWSLLVLAASAALYYVCTSVLTRGMTRKAYGDVFSCRAGMIENGGKDLVSGRLVATPTEIMFVRRKGDMGGCRVCWSASVPAVRSYSLGKVDDYHMGIKFVIKGEKKDVIFPSKEIAGLEKEFRAAIGWADEEDSPSEN